MYKPKKSVIFVIAIVVSLILFFGANLLYMVVYRSMSKSRIDVNSLSAEALARRGIDYALLEMSQVPEWAWFTHKINLDGTGVPSTNPPQLTKVASSPDISFAGGSIDPDSGIYTPPNIPAGQTLEVITYREFYPDPDESPAWSETGVLVIRARAEVDGVRKAYEFRVSNRSLYDFFIFRYGPTTLYDTYDGAGFGGMHFAMSPDDVDNGRGVAFIYSPEFYNLTEMSTNGYFKRWKIRYYAPYKLDTKTASFWSDDSKDGLAPMWEYSVGDIAFDLNKQSFSYYDLASHFSCHEGGYVDPSETAWTVNQNYPTWHEGGNSTIMTPFLDTEWEWDKYDGYAHDVGLAAGEQTVRFVIPEYEFENLGIDITDAPSIGKIKDTDPEWDTYWKAKHRQYWAHPDRFDFTIADWTDDDEWQAAVDSLPDSKHANKEWLRDLTYGNDRVDSGVETAWVRWRNTSEQSTDWNQWLQDNGLYGKVKDHNTGCPEAYKPVEVVSSFKEIAKTPDADGKVGLYIDATTDYDIKIYHGEDNDITASLPNLTKNKSFWNPRQPPRYNPEDPDPNIDDFNYCDTTSKIWDDVTGEWYNITDENGRYPCKTLYNEIDLSELVATIKAGGVLDDFNGVIYVESTDDTHIAHDFGVVLKNTKQLPYQGLTVVTPHNVYLYGSYNTEKVDSSNTPNPSGKIPPASVISANRAIYPLSEEFAGFDTEAEDDHDGTGGSSDQKNFASSDTWPYTPVAPFAEDNNILSEPDPSKPEGVADPYDLFDLGTAAEIGAFHSGGNVTASGWNLTDADTIPDNSIGAFEHEGQWYIAARDTLGNLYVKDYGAAEPNSTARVDFTDELRDLAYYWQDDREAEFTASKGYFDICDISDVSGNSEHHLALTPDDSQYNTALVSPYSSQYFLERWYDRMTSSAKDLNFHGAFIELPPDYRESIPSMYYYPGVGDAPHPYAYWYYGSWQFGVGNAHIFYTYNPNFGDPDNLDRPPGAFTATMPGSWREFDPDQFTQL